VTVSDARAEVLHFPAVQVLQRPDWHGSPVHLGELFMVRKNNVEARCVLRSHQFGWEVCLQIGISREFVQTKVCRRQAEVLTTGEQWKAAMIEKGGL
jgi:hypothetical protein